MVGFTDAHLRLLLRRLNPDVWLWTEMEKCDGRKDGWRGLRHYGVTDKVVLQLGANSVSAAVDAARRGIDLGYNEINLNCGCPSIETGGASNYGASMMRDASRVADVAAAVAVLPGAHKVSVKCRLGVYENTDAMAADMAGEGYADRLYASQLQPFVSTIAGAADHVVVHARCAVLGGLSPKQNRLVPALDHELVHRLAQDFPSLRVTLNGGVGSFDQVETHLPHVNGVMCGRWFLRRPLDLALGDTRVAARALDAYGAHAAGCVARREAVLADVATPLLLVCEQLLDDGYDERLLDEQLLDGDVSDALHDAAEGLLGKREPSLKRLSKALGKAIGTKVASKVSKNRGEGAAEG